jgi:adenylate cyclase
MGADEARTLGVVRSFNNEIFAPAIEEFQGRIVKFMGDGALVEFGSVVDAVDAAVAIQQRIRERASSADKGPMIELRIGINLGDVMVEDSDIYGDGVNVAARIQQLAEPGGIAISATAWEHAKNRVSHAFRDGGEQNLKNISAPVRIYHWSEGATASPHSFEAPALPDKPSIAVLPFDNMSGDPDQEYFADGVVESITAALSRIRAFFVIARNSAFAYKGKPINIQQVGRELGVAYVLEGSVQRAGQRVRITVQLIETRGGAHLWADKFDGALDDIFELQDLITERVAGALQPSIRLAEIERVRTKKPQDWGAYDYTMRAIRHVWMLEHDEAKRAMELLDKALEIDPDYPLALALSAWCWAQHSVYNWTHDFVAAKAKALEQAERAANLSSDDPLILGILGAVHTFARNYGAARVLLERAIQLDPNAAWALSRLGWLEVYSDRPEQARSHFEKALRLSPLDPMNFNNYVGLGSSYEVAGDYEKAAEFYTRALQERPKAYWIHRNLAPMLRLSGRHEEARVSCEIMMKHYPDLTVERFKTAMVFPQHVLDVLGRELAALGVPER